HHALTEIDLRFDNGFDKGEDIAWPDGSPHPLFAIAPSEREAARRACAKQLERIDGLRSQTIHSFCQSLLRTFPLEARLDPQCKKIEGFEGWVVYGEVYEGWIDHETRVAPFAAGLRQWETLVEHVGYLFFIRDIIFELADRRDLLLDERYSLGDMMEVEGDIV